jgi:hypothetical protein
MPTFQTHAHRLVFVKLSQSCFICYDKDKLYSRLYVLLQDMRVLGVSH